MRVLLRQRCHHHVPLQATTDELQLLCGVLHHIRPYHAAVASFTAKAATAATAAPTAAATTMAISAAITAASGLPKLVDRRRSSE